MSEQKRRPQRQPSQNMGGGPRGPRAMGPRQPINKESLKRLMGYVKPYWPRLLVVNADLVRGDADVADQAFFLCLRERFVHARAVARPVALRHLVQLIEVQIVGLQIPQGGVQIFPELFGRFCLRLGGNVNLVTHAFKGNAELFFAVGIGAGGVEKGHAAGVSLAQKHDGIIGGNALDGKGAEGVLRGGDAGAA